MTQDGSQQKKTFLVGAQFANHRGGRVLAIRYFRCRDGILGMKCSTLGFPFDCFRRPFTQGFPFKNFICDLFSTCLPTLRKEGNRRGRFEGIFVSFVQRMAMAFQNVGGRILGVVVKRLGKPQRPPRKLKRIRQLFFTQQRAHASRDVRWMASTKICWPPFPNAGVQDPFLG